MRIRPTEGGWRRTVLAAVAAVGLVAAIGCNDNAPVTPPSPTVGVQIVSSAVSLGAGQTGTVDIIVSRKAGYAGDVTLAVAGAPAGLAARFEPATLPAGTSAARLSLVLQANAALDPGTYTLDVRAIGADGAPDVASLFLVVTPTFP